MALIGSKTEAVHHPGLQGRQVRQRQRHDVLGKWAVFFFYPADFTFVCPTELEDLADNYADAPEAGRRGLFASRPTRISATRPGTTRSPAIGKINYSMLGDQNHTHQQQFRRAARRPGPGRSRHLRGRSGGRDPARSKSPPKASAATPPSCCARSRPRSMSPRIRAKSARPSGKRARRPSPPSLDLVGKI